MTMNNENIFSAAEKTPAMWHQVLQQHAALQHQGRTFIVLTAQGNLAAANQIPDGGREVKFKVVAAIIAEFVKREIDPTLKKNLSDQLVSLAKHTVIHYPSKSIFASKKSLTAARKVLELNQASPNSETASSSSTTSTKPSVVPTNVTETSRTATTTDSRAASATHVPTDLSRIVSSPQMLVQRSKVGRDGAYFLTLDHLTAIVKFVRLPLRPIFADRFFQALGFKTPNTRLATADEVSSETKALILAKGSPLAPDNKSKAQRQLVFMDYLGSPTWENTLMGDRQQALKSPMFAKQIGKMLVLDLIIGNTDRIAKGNFNSGNFMVNIDEDEDEDTSSYDLVLCDNEIRLDDDGIYYTRRHELSKLLKDPEVLLQYLFESRFVQPDMLTTRERKKFLENVNLGMLEGAREFLQLCKDPEKPGQIFDTRGLPTELIQIDYLKRLISVKDNLDHMMEK